jgi:hypothetical protein
MSAIKNEMHHFDLPPVPSGPFVGKGPEVDAMWDYITDGSMSKNTLPIFREPTNILD